MYDFAVVGVGPAGARFAREAATAGYDVIAFERGTVGTPLACSGHVSTDIWEYVPDEKKAELRQNEIHGARFHVGGPQTDSHPFYKREAVSNVIDRVDLDKTLSTAAQECGADVREEHTVTDINEKHSGVTLTVSHGEGEEKFHARMVAGCDGPISRVRRQSGLPEPHELLHGVLAFDSTVDNADFVDVHLTAPQFFAWRIPRGKAGVEYGLAAPPSESVPELFDQLTDTYNVKTEQFCSGAIPIGPPNRIHTRRVFLIGDAAAQTKPFTGGGILYGMTAADAAAATIEPDDPATLRDYDQAWREELSSEIALGRWIRRAYSLPPVVQQAGLRALSGEIAVHMDRPSSLFSRDQLRALVGR
ncbi:geranylgeranyl reductase family protein [Haloquadratum walsbyi]|jgi:geranylgeranyl reductase family|uniref:Geranylgeranyl reductase family n=1 Tax=Haloquadratum walsbyi J07HQW2 TaxID=1238425 RepID=U1MYA4_9EURY|nr:geranylgeranyl reductase family protein [Haloquadratum walsbyi]ERG95464.1 MAG: geranylgeranyl reductase family [Haloquadratum walsbyi J07HQW2]